MTVSSSTVSDEQAALLLERLVAIPSLSGEESRAARSLVEWMAEHGYERAQVDEAGNAVGEIGSTSAAHTVVLLGHIDTVPGEIPVRVETVRTEEVPAGEPALFGRGSVDAKGPLATFAVAVARLGSAFARERDLRLVVAGAVEEEAATSRGARFLASRFGGVEAQAEPIPAACIIGEPSRWHRVTLGYKGRLLVDLVARREMSHTAGPDPGLGVLAVELWQQIVRWAEDHNQERPSPFEQLQPSLRRLHCGSSDGLFEEATATVGLRLPLGFDVEALERRLAAWRDARSDAGELRLETRGYEPAWKSERDTPLVRAFLGAIREQGVRPGFVVKTGTSDMNVVAPQWRCPILAYGPGDSALDHTPNEHLPLAEYSRAIQVLEQALRNLQF